MNRKLVSLLTLAALAFSAISLVASAAWAEEEITEDQIKGVVRIKMSKDYAKVSVNDGDWEDHEFANNGFTAVVRELPRNRTHTITLTPADDDFAPITVTIEPDDYKKKTKRKGRTRILSFVAEKTVKFEKAPKEAPKPPAQPEGTAPPASPGG